MPSPKNLHDLANVLDLTEKEVKSILFNVVDLLVSNRPPEGAIENGMYCLPNYVRDDQFVEAYSETLWATYKNLVGEEIDKKMWVSLTLKGIVVTEGRPE